MSLLEIKEMTHSFGETVLYQNASLTLHKGEHMGVVGQNGAGKSTLLKICTEQVIPDRGHIIWQPNICVGYLDQYAEIDKSNTVEEFLQSAFSKLYTMVRAVEHLYEKAAAGDTRALEKAGQYQEQLEQHDFYNIQTKIEQVAEGLGLSAIGLERTIGALSGGQRAKVILAKLLLEKPDVLLLDEPTNFLDKNHVTWLTSYLSGLENAFLVVSHDAAFLGAVVNRICDIDHQKITKYYGTYHEFLKKKTFLREDYMRQYTTQQKEIQKTEAFIRKNIAGRKSRMARGRQKQLDRMEKLDTWEQKENKPVFSFSALPVTHREQLAVKGLSIGYQYPLLSNITFCIAGGEKVVITGCNGIGKSTILKTLVGILPPLQGTFQFSEQGTIGYFAQDLQWYDGTYTPIQVVSHKFPKLDTKEVRKRLAQCGISKKHAMQAINTLSGGEQAKVKLCLLTIQPCHFLILDEPTNHLDIQAKEALQRALAAFPGSVLLVSHEEAFYKDWIQKILPIDK